MINLDCKLTIILPVFNVKLYLEECIRSIYSQNFEGFELIAVEDCSTDGSKELLLKLSTIYGFKVIYQLENKGPSVARNIGIEQAKGKYICFFDSDDFLEEGFIKSISSYLYDDYDVLVFDYYRNYENGVKKRNKKHNIIRKLSQIDIDESNKLPLLDNFNVVWNKIYSVDFLRDNNIIFDVGYYEDIPFTFKIVFCLKKAKVIDSVGYNYRQRDGSILHTNNAKHQDIIIQYQRIFNYISSKKSDTNVDVYTVIMMNKLIRHFFHILCFKRFRLTPQTERCMLLFFKDKVKDCKVGDFSGRNKIKYYYLKLVPINLNVVFSKLIRMIVRLLK